PSGTLPDKAPHVPVPVVSVAHPPVDVQPSPSAIISSDVDSPSSHEEDSAHSSSGQDEEPRSRRVIRPPLRYRLQRLGVTLFAALPLTDVTNVDWPSVAV